MCDGREAGQHQPCPHDVNLLDGLAPEKADQTELHNDELVELLCPPLADIVHVDGGALHHVHVGCYDISKSEEILKTTGKSSLYFYFCLEDRYPSRCWVTTTSGHRYVLLTILCLAVWSKRQYKY